MYISFFVTFVIINVMRNKILQLILLFLALYGFVTAQDSIDYVEWSKANSFYQEADTVYDVNVERSIVLYDSACIHYKKSRYWDDYVDCLNTLAVVYYYKGELDLYLEYSKRAIKEAEIKLPSNHPYYSTALNNLNTYYYDLGNYEKSISFLKKSLDIEKSNNASDLDIAIAYNNIGASLTNEGSHKQALEYLLKALELRENAFQLNSSSRTGWLIFNTRNNIGRAYFLAGDLEQSAVYFRLALSEGLQVYKKAKRTDRKYLEVEIISSLQEMGRIHLEKGEFDKAFDKVKEAMLYQKKENSFRKSFSHEILGEINFANKNYTQAIHEYEKAVAISKVNNAQSNLPVYARKIARLANAKQELGFFEEAIFYYQNALKILAPDFEGKGNRNPLPSELYSKLDALEILNGKGDALWAKYQKSKDKAALLDAHATFLSGIKVAKNIREGVMTKAAKNTLSEKTVSLYEGAMKSALEQYKNTKNENILLEAFKLAESNKSQLLLESLNEQTALSFKELPDSLLQKDKELKLQIAYYQKQLIETQSQKETDASKIKEHKNQLFNLKAELQKLTDHFEESYPRFYNLKYQEEKINIPQWQKKLAANNQALIEYFVGEEKIYVFTLWAEGCKVFEVDKIDAVFQSIQTFQDAINQVPADDAVLQNYQDITTAGYHLYENILAPALKVLPGNIHRLKIIPDNQFNYVPFDLLLMEKAPQTEAYFSSDHLEYVLEKYQVSYDYSATWMFKSEKNNKSYTRNFIAYAPSFKKATSIARSRSCNAGDLYNLECSEEEILGINDLLNGETRLGASANTTDFIKEAADYRIIHMATHACVDEENPSFNKIFLTDDYLSNADLYNTSLNAELVVLSACNTGSGKLVKGEGVLSLARGFVQAGCGSSIVSRWSVDDCATSKIMQLFYQGLEKGEEKDEALRLAKLEYLDGTDRFNAHPYYWSAFVGYGDMGAMEFGYGGKWMYFMFAGVMVLLGGVAFKMTK
jgi:CHAT domain-containing protein